MLRRVGPLQAQYAERIYGVLGPTREPEATRTEDSVILHRDAVVFLRQSADLMLDTEYFVKHLPDIAYLGSRALSCHTSPQQEAAISHM